MAKYFEKQGTAAITPSVFQRYQADGIHSDPGLAAWRYIFESRGLDISDWNTQPTNSYGRSLDTVQEELLAIEPVNSRHYKVLQDIMKRPQFEACPLWSKNSLQVIY
jgi:hypothetical protein